MEGTKRRAANSLGMFDLLKGVGMLTIVFAHTGELYPMGDASHINPLTFCMFAYRESLMAAFYIASGYGFRKRSIGKCIDQQFKTLLKPYIYTGIATTVFHLSSITACSAACTTPPTRPTRCWAALHWACPTRPPISASCSSPAAPCGICSR